MSILESTVNNIDSLDKTSIEQAKKRLDRLIKPQGSLGKMEDICMQLAGIHKSKYLVVANMLNKSHTIHKFFFGFAWKSNNNIC